MTFFISTGHVQTGLQESQMMEAFASTSYVVIDLPQMFQLLFEWLLCAFMVF